MTTAGLVFTTTTLGGSSTFNSSLATNPITSPSSGLGYWAGSVYFPDIMRNPFNIGIGVSCALGGVATTYNVEHSFDDYLAPTYVSSSATWFPNSGITAASSNTTGNYAFPVRAIRLNVTTAGSSTQTVTMTLIQAAGD